MALKTALFTRQTEDFDCEECGTHVKGNGYTNHCPCCLCSKHVDVNPGDRASDCHALLYPVAYEQKNGTEYIIHECSQCNHVRRNKVASEDSREAIIALSNGTYEEYLEKLHRRLFKGESKEEKKLPSSEQLSLLKTKER